VLPNTPIFELNYSYDAVGNRTQTVSLGGFTTLYDITPDGHPIVGPLEEMEGFWCDCGWSGNGFAPAPSGGRSLAQMIMGRDPDIDLSYFQWPRRTEVVRRPMMDWITR